MSLKTPSMAKNAIARCLEGIIDPPLKTPDKNRIRDYFDNECAYCGIDIDPQSRKGHFDHLVSRADGGTNDMHNVVLACNTCNGDLKRERDWLEFLHEIAGGALQEREQHIRKWLELAPPPRTPHPNEERIIATAKADFDKHVTEMRKIRDSAKS